MVKRLSVILVKDCGRVNNDNRQSGTKASLRRA